MKKILTTKKIRKNKVIKAFSLSKCLPVMITKMHALLDNTELDLILVGDSLGNVILGYDTTVEVSIDEMIVFTSAVKRGQKIHLLLETYPLEPIQL